MFCPECGGEFRDGIFICPDCEVELELEALEDSGDGHDHSPAVMVFKTADLGRLALAEALLEGAGIAYAVRGARAVGLGSGAFLPRTGGDTVRSAQIEVPASREKEAEAVLSRLQEGEEEPVEVLEEQAEQGVDDAGDVLEPK